MTHSMLLEKILMSCDVQSDNKLRVLSKVRTTLAKKRSHRDNIFVELIEEILRRN